MKFLSLFDGCHMFGLGARRAGLDCAGTSEIDTHAANVTRYHYPDTPQLGDVRNVGTTDADIVIGGFPCQDLSVAGDRRGLAGERSGLFWEIMRIARDNSPRWLLLENVPGLLSSNGGRDMGTVIGALGELGYGVAWRVLDAQYLGVPQRRRRVFIVGCLGDARRAGEVLFEPESVRGNPTPRKGPRAGVAGSVDGCTGVLGSVSHTLTGEGFDASEDGSGRGTPVVARCPAHSGRLDGDTETFVIKSEAVGRAVTAGPGGKSWMVRTSFCLTAREPHAVAQAPRVVDLAQVTSAHNRSNPQPGDPPPTLAATGRHAAFNWRGDDYAPGPVSPCLDTDSSGSIATTGQCVRRLMPIECERLQGLPDDWTRYGRKESGEVYELSDSARYKMIGNGGFVGAVEWIARRIIDTGRRSHTLNTTAERATRET